MAGSRYGEGMSAPGSGSRPGELVAAAAYGEDEAHLLRSLDYPCTRLLRLRRLLAYHRRYSCKPVYDSMKENMRVIFHVEDFMKLVKIGQWRKAASYLMRFFQSDVISEEANLLMYFHNFLMSLDDFASGKVMVTCLISDWILKIYREPVLAKYPFLANLVADVLFLRSDHASASVDWLAVRKNAAEMMGDMVRKTPELRGKLNLPRGPNDLYHVVPIQSSFGRHRAKDVRVKQPALVLAQFFLQTKQRLPSSESSGATHTFSGSTNISSEQLMELLDKALKAGSSPIIEHGGIPEHFNECYFPLVQMLSKRPFFNKILEIKDITLSPVVPASQVTNSAMKQKLKDAGHPESNLKRPRTSGSFGEAPSSRFDVLPGLSLLRSLDYPCTRRLRLRRLLAYHRRYTYEPIFDVIKERMNVIFHVKDFMKLVKLGLWRNATSYLTAFFPSDLVSPKAKLLMFFLKFLMSLNGFANGVIVMTCLIYDWILNIYREPVLFKYPYLTSLVADVLFLRSDHASASLNWLAIRKKAAEMMGDMVLEIPELREKLNPPRGPKDLYHIVRIQSSFGRHRAKDVRIKQPSLVLAQFFLQTKQRLSSLEFQGATHTFSGSENICGQLMELLDKALKAGSSSVIEQHCIPEHFSECFPLVRMLSKPPFINKILEINAMKRKHKDAGHPENNLKRQQTSGCFGELWSANKITRLSLPYYS